MKYFQLSTVSERYHKDYQRILTDTERKLRRLELSANVENNYLRQSRILCSALRDISDNALEYLTQRDIEEEARSAKKLCSAATPMKDETIEKENSHRENEDYIRRSDRAISDALEKMKRAKKQNNIGCHYLVASIPLITAIEKLGQYADKADISRNARKLIRNRREYCSKAAARTRTLIGKYRCR